MGDTRFDQWAEVPAHVQQTLSRYPASPSGASAYLLETVLTFFPAPGHLQLACEAACCPQLCKWSTEQPQGPLSKRSWLSRQSCLRRCVPRCQTED